MPTFEWNAPRCLRASFAALTVITAMSLGVTARAQTQESLPVVTSASVPFYPRMAQAAHISGEVLLRVSTDGTRVSAVSVEDGPSMLAAAAVENVKTWQFEKHKPMQFETTFHYSITLGGCDADCNCDSAGHNTVLLNLPSDIEIIGKAIPTCDPIAVRKRR